MRIDGWRISSFGILRDYETRALPPGLTVLFGPNEAGKTTLLEFIRQMLFGLASGPDGTLVYPALRGGRYGGRLFVAGPEGTYSIERGGTAQPPHVTRPDGSSGSAVDIQRLLGGCDRRLFESIFAFSLTELQDFARLDVESIHDRLFSAGISGAGRGVREATEGLARSRSFLYSEADRSGRLPELAEQIGEIERGVATARAELDDYPGLLSRRDELGRAIDTLAGEIEVARAEEQRWQLLAELWPIWYRRQTIAGELEQLHEPSEAHSFESESKLRELLASIDQARTTELRLASESAALIEQRDELRPDEALLDDELSRDTNRLVEAFPRYQEQSSLLEQAVTRQRRQERERDDRLRQLGSSWNEARLLSFDEVAISRDDVRRFGELLRGGEQDVAARSAVVAMARRQLEVFRQSMAQPPEVSGSEPSLTIDEMRLRQVALVRLRDGAGELAILDARIEEANQARSRLEAARVQIATASSAEAGGGLLHTIRRLFGLLPSPDTSIQDALREQQERVESDLAGYARRREELAAAAAPDREAAGLDGPLEQPAIEAEMRRLVELRERADRRARAAREDSALRQSLADGQVALDRASEELASAQRSWTDWKSANGFHRALSPDGVIETLDLVRQAAEAQRQVQQLAREVERLSGLTGAFQTEAIAVLRRLSESVPDDLSVAVESLRARLAQDHVNVRRRLLLEQRLAESEQRRVQAERQLELLEAERDRLFRSLGVDDETGFRRAVELRAMREERRNALRECDARIESRLTAAPNAEWMRRQLALGDIEGWQHERKAAGGRVRRVIGDRDALVAERHDVETACRQWETSTTIPDLEQQLTGLREAFRDALADWWRLSLAERMIVDTQARFERERQPAVLATASDYFATLTAGAYHRLRQQGRRIVVIDRHGRVRSPEALSRGTIEQLYLCIRLGLVTDFAERVVPLPIIMDDVLVNVDPQRARLVAEVLARVAQRHQILLFTCHPETAGILRSVVPNCGLYAMSRYGGGIQPVPPGQVQPGNFTS